MLGVTEETEQKYPKMVIGISGAVVLSILVMGGQLTYKWGVLDERLTQATVDIEATVSEARRAHDGFVLRSEYAANNEAVLRELQRMNRQLEQIAQSHRNAERNDN